MNLSAIHNRARNSASESVVVCDIGGYEFVSYSQREACPLVAYLVVCDIGGYEFVSYSQRLGISFVETPVVCDIGGYEFVSYSQLELVIIKIVVRCL